MLDYFEKIFLKNSKFTSRTIFLLALSVSFIFRFIYPNIFHHFDVTTFVEWGKSFDPIQDIYMTSCYCNYPILGMILSTGILKLFAYQIFSFLILLCFVDALNVLLVLFIIKLLKIPYAIFWAGLIGLSLSSWIGGAQWGQIDNIGQLFLFVILIFIYFFLKLGIRSKNTINIIILLIGISISCLLLTKQLLLFPIVPILIFLFCYLFHFSTKLQFFTSIFSLILAIIFPIIMIDWWLNIPESYYFSHFEKIFTIGSEHINTISGNGFNIWMFFYSNQNQSSIEVLLFGLSAKKLGLLIFVLFNLLTFNYLFTTIKRIKNSLNFKLLFVLLLGVFAFYNLMFNLVLTGTHERYLYHFYPYLIIFLLYINHNYFDKIKFIKYDIILAIIGSLLYGFFVFCILMKYLDSLIFHKFLMFFHLMIMIRLMYILNKLKNVIRFS